MNKVKAYCPASIGFIFKACPNKNLLKMGSVGIGATVDQGVTVTVEKSTKTKITFNQKPIHFPTVLTVLKSLTRKPLTVSIQSSLPLGFGFGLSGASSLATAFATNRLLDLKRTERELEESAHIAEIMNKTGLGSVGTQITGGIIIKTAPGIPVRARRLSLEKNRIYAIIISRLLTPSILKDNKKIERINTIAEHQLEKINQLSSPTLENIFDASFEFVRKSGLASRKVLSFIEKIKKAGGHATMAILGYVIFSSCYPPDDIKYEVRKLTITKEKVALLPS